MDAERTVNVALAYNVFDLTDLVREELVYEEGKNLDHYLVGLPDDCSWKIGLNAIPVEPEEFAVTEVKPEDTITIVAIPRGGQGGKQILRLVAMVALVVGAAILLGPGALGIAGLGLTGTTFAAAFGAAVLVGSFLINLAIGTGVPKNKSKDDGQSYGFDGAKNTAKEGTPLPVVYGQFRVAGNYVDIYTQNVGDDQYLYGRITLSDGEIDSVVGEPEINEQAISNYKNVQWGYTHGVSNESVNNQFKGSKQQFYRDDKLTTGYSQYDTTGNVDGFEIDFMFPQGLADINTKTGAKTNFSVTVEIQYAPYGTSNWTNVGTTTDVTTIPDSWGLGIAGLATKGSIFTLRHQANKSVGVTGTSSYSLQYKQVGDSTWTTHETITDNSTSVDAKGSWAAGDDSYNSFNNQIYDNGYSYNTIYPERTTNLTLPSGQYEFQTTSGGTLLGGSVIPDAVAPASGGTGASTQITYTDSRTKTLRRTFKSPTLPRGRYSIRYRRTADDSAAHQDHISELHCTGVTEVQHSNVSLSNIATGWYVAKMTDQLSGIPNVTWLVKGVKVDIYDNNGAVTATQWSANPADIVLDMLISEKRGPLRDKVKIDFPAYVQWREYCDAQGLMFNGVFDEATTLWDALQVVYKVGHAYPVRTGSRLSVAVDKPGNPAQLFGPGNIFKDTFQITYLGQQDRANEFEVSYYDVSDRNKKKTIRIADPQAAQAGQIPKTVQYDLIGVDNFTQAQKEIWYQLYNNRLSRRIVTFDAPVEAIGLTLGDIALVQHDMMDWGESGRLASATNASNVVLDKQVTIEAGKTYSLLVTHDKVARATCNLTLITGTTYNLTNLSNTSNATDSLKRLQTNTTQEAEILDFDYTGGTGAIVTLSANVTGTTATLYDVDSIEERTVSTAASTTDHIAVTTPFSITPTPLCNYMFGEQTTVKRPYRLSGISGDGLDRRTLTFGEYNDYIYSDPETVVPAPGTAPSMLPAHVVGLVFAIDPIRTGTAVSGHLTWVTNNTLNYAGADIYMSVNGADYTFLNTVQNTNNVAVTAQEGTTVAFKVVAFNTSGIRANINNAPVTTKTITTAAGSLALPTGLTWTLDKVNFFAQGKVSWTLGDSSTGRVSPVSRVQVQYGGTITWLDKGLTNQTELEITNIPAGNHTFRVRAENATGEISDWVTQTFTIAVPSIVAPVVPADGTAIDHTINTDGSADISFEWTWGGNEADIDGFQLITHSASTSGAYTLGTTVASEHINLLATSKRAAIFRGFAANLYYTYYVRAYKRVDSSFASSGMIYSTAVKSTYAGENPYQPSTTVAFNGDITGTINGLDTTQINDWTHFTNVPGNLGGLTGTEDIQNNLFDLYQDLGGTGGRARITLRSSGSNVGSFLTPSDTLQNLGITIGSGAINGIGTGTGTLVQNSLVSLTSTGALSGGGGGSITNLDYSNIGGATRPANNATVGATWGTNLSGRPTNLTSLVGTEDIQNSALDLTQDLGGTGGRVRLRLLSTAAGVGSYLTPNDGLQNLGIGVNGSGQITGIGTGVNTTVNNNLISLGSNGALSGGGGGSITALDFNNVSGTTKPANNATVGAILGPGGNVTGAVDANLRPLVDFSQSSHINKTIDYINDGTTYARLPSANTTGTGTARRALIDFTQSHTNKSLANVDSAANTKLGGIATGATKGATWGTDVGSIPANLSSLVGTEGINNSLLSIHQSGTSFTLLGGGGGSAINMNGLAGSTYLFAKDTRNPEQVFTPAPNLLYNGSFRLSSRSGSPLGWTLGSGWSLVSSGGTEGSFIRIASGGTSAATSDPFPCYGGQTYTLQGEMFAQGMSAGGIYLDIQWFKDAAGTVPTTAGASDGGPDVGAVNGAGWAPYSNQLVSPSDAVSGRVRAFIAGATNTNAAVRRVKVAGYSALTPFSDEATNSSTLLTTSGTGAILGDGFQVPPVVAAGGRYFYSSAPTFGSATSTQAVITLNGGTLTIGDRTQTYPTMTRTVTGSGTQTFFLYGDDPAYSGTLTNGLQATTSTTIPYQGNGRIYFGKITVTFTTGSTGTGGSGGGGGWDQNNF